MVALCRQGTHYGPIVTQTFAGHEGSDIASTTSLALSPLQFDLVSNYFHHGLLSVGCIFGSPYSNAQFAPSILIFVSKHLLTTGCQCQVQIKCMFLSILL